MRPSASGRSWGRLNRYKKTQDPEPDANCLNPIFIDFTNVLILVKPKINELADGADITKILIKLHAV